MNVKDRLNLSKVPLEAKALGSVKITFTRLSFICLFTDGVVLISLLVITGCSDSCFEVVSVVKDGFTRNQCVNKIIFP